MNWLYLKELLKKLYNSATDNLITKGILAGWAYFGGIHLYIYLVFGLKVFDCVTGIIAARRKGEPFTSKILKKGLIEKAFLYVIIIVAVFFLEMQFKSIFPLGYIVN